MVASPALAVANWRLICMIRVIASFARVTASASPSSASPRSDWMSAVMPLSCCASTCAALMTAPRAAAVSGLVVSTWSELANSL